MKLTEEQLDGMYYYIETLTAKKKMLKKFPNTPKYCYDIWIPIFGSMDEISEMEAFLKTTSEEGTSNNSNFNRFMSDINYMAMIAATKPLLYSIYTTYAIFTSITDNNNNFFFDSFNWNAYESTELVMMGKRVKLVYGVIKLRTFNDISTAPVNNIKNYNLLLEFLEEATSKFIWHFEFLKLLNREIMEDVEYEEGMSDKEKKLSYDAKPYKSLKRLKIFKSEKNKKFKSELNKVKIIPGNVAKHFIGYDYEDIIKDSATKLMTKSAGKYIVKKLFENYDYSTGEKIMLSVIYDNNFKIVESNKPIYGINT